MPYKSKRKRKAYGKRWRAAHPSYMTDYMRSYTDPVVAKIKREHKQKSAR